MGLDARLEDKDLIGIWSDISENNVVSLSKNLNRRLMKKIAEKEGGPSIDGVNIVCREAPASSNQMWDSEKSEWVPFDLWGASFIVNQRKEYVVLRMFRPCTVQPEFGDTIYGWHSIDSSYLNEILSEKKRSVPVSNLFKSYSGYRDFCAFMRQDKEISDVKEKTNNGRCG